MSVALLATILLLAFGAWVVLFFQGTGTTARVPAATTTAKAPASTAPVAFNPPNLEDAPPKIRDAVLLGYKIMEMETEQFYARAAARTGDVDIRRLLDDLAQAERRHEANAQHLAKVNLDKEALETEDATKRRLYALQIVQPGLAGLMRAKNSLLAWSAALASSARRTELSSDS